MKELFVIGITFTLACGVFAAQSRKLDIDVSGWTLQVSFNRSAKIPADGMHEAILQFGPPNVYAGVCLPNASAVPDR